LKAKNQRIQPTNNNTKIIYSLSNVKILNAYMYILRGYHTLQGDNSLKSVESFDHMMFVCRFQASRWSNHREKSCYVASEFIALSLLVGIC